MTLLVLFTTGQFIQREHEKTPREAAKAAGPARDLGRQAAGSPVRTHILSDSPDEGCAGAGNLRPEEKLILCGSRTRERAAVQDTKPSDTNRPTPWKKMWPDPIISDRRRCSWGGGGPLSGCHEASTSNSPACWAVSKHADWGAGTFTTLQR